MNPSPTASTSASHVGTFLGVFGLTVIQGALIVACLALTILVPPWSEIHCQRRQTLYWSERIEVRNSSFAGFDFLFSGEKWTMIKTPPNPSSEMKFESKEYGLCWPLLVCEWAVVLTVGGVSYYRLTRRIFHPDMRTAPPVSSTTSSTATETPRPGDS